MLCSTDVSLKRAVNSPKRHNPWCRYFLPEFKETSSQLQVLSNKRLPPLDYLSISTIFFHSLYNCLSAMSPITIPYISLAKRLRQLVPLKRRTTQCNVSTESVAILVQQACTWYLAGFPSLDYRSTPSLLTQYYKHWLLVAWLWLTGHWHLGHGSSLGSEVACRPWDNAEFDSVSMGWVA